jgi:hypothetical protein
MFSEAEEYHKQTLKTDIKQAKLGMILLGLLLVVFLFNDYQFFGLSPRFLFIGSYKIWGFISIIGLICIFKQVQKLSFIRIRDFYLVFMGRISKHFN